MRRLYGEKRIPYGVSFVTGPSLLGLKVPGKGGGPVQTTVTADQKGSIETLQPPSKDSHLNPAYGLWD